MKSVVRLSLISFVAIVLLYGGYIAYLSKSAAGKRAAVAGPDKKELEAIAFELEALERKKSEVLAVEERMRSMEMELEAQRKALIQEQHKMEKLLQRLTAERKALAVGQDKAITKLAKMYEMMKPKDAAQISANLSIELLARIIPRMKERAAAKLIAAMETSKAVQITQRLGRSAH